MQGNGTALTAREILKMEYGDSRNFLTPHRLAIGKLGRHAAYEVSAGEGIEPGTKLYGVSVVRVTYGTNSMYGTERDYESSVCFSSLEAANEHVEQLRASCETNGNGSGDSHWGDNLDSLDNVGNLRHLHTVTGGGERSC